MGLRSSFFTLSHEEVLSEGEGGKKFKNQMNLGASENGDYDVTVLIIQKNQEIPISR